MEVIEIVDNYYICSHAVKTAKRLDLPEWRKGYIPPVGSIGVILETTQINGQNVYAIELNDGTSILCTRLGFINKLLVNVNEKMPIADLKDLVVTAINETSICHLYIKESIEPIINIIACFKERMSIYELRELFKTAELYDFVEHIDIYFIDVVSFEIKVKVNGPNITVSDIPSLDTGLSDVHAKKLPEIKNEIEDETRRILIEHGLLKN